MTGEFDLGPLPPSGPHPLSANVPEAVRHALAQAGVTRFYPGFDAWYFGKVVPGARNGERRILTNIVDGVLAGVAICKRSGSESKLCTLWVAPQARGLGIAADLADEAFAWLGTTKPVFTVPEERIAEFGKLLRAWSFTDHVQYRGLYRNRRLEHVFNARKA